MHSRPPLAWTWRFWTIYNLEPASATRLGAQLRGWVQEVPNGGPYSSKYN